MAELIKTPADAPEPKTGKTPGAVYNGEPGMQKRTAGAGGPPEITHDRGKPDMTPEKAIKTPVPLNTKK